jgi:tetratricopeptide (TPR) repeat protein
MSRACFRRACALLVLSLACVPARAVHAQGTSAAELVAAGDRERAAHRSAQALAQYEAAIARDSTLATARWKAAGEAIDLGEAEKNERERRQYYDRAVKHARKAVELAPRDADAHFQLARAIGRTALSVGPRDRVKFAGEVRTHALRSLELDPRHAGSLHVMGVWNAEVMRLNSITRALAKTFLGGKVFNTASWAEAARYLEQAVAIQPTRAVHHLDLARVYRDMDRKADARREYEATISSPSQDANDPTYKAEATAELRALK